METRRRLFVGVSVPDWIREDVDRQTSQLRQLGDVKWVDPANFHLTLRFFGDTPSETIPIMRKEIRAAVLSVPVFEAALGGIGAFPSTKRPRVLWIGVVLGEESLTRLGRDLEAIARRMGFTPESRQFNSHLTIGRVRSSTGLSAFCKNLERFVFGRTKPFWVSDCTLYESILAPKGPIYQIVENFALGGGTRRTGVTSQHSGVGSPGTGN